jgi:hypothetical protein
MDKDQGREIDPLVLVPAVALMAVTDNQEDEGVSMAARTPSRDRTRN